MPRYLILKKSGVHRAACFALYRALLRQKHKLQLDQHQQHLFRSPIQALFRRNSKLQSPAQISTALQLGYETLEGLQNGERQQRILDRIFELATQPRSNARLENLPSSPQSNTVRAPKIHAAPYPGAARTLARPFQNLSGRRHVPVLVNANQVPFLRLKKPQSPFLSRIILDTIKTRQKRIDKAEKLASELPFAEDEDEWDHILYEHFRLGSGDPLEEPWQREVELAIKNLNELRNEAVQRRVDISAEMYAIVEQEKALAEAEKLRIRDEKHKVRKARRLARRGWTESEIQEKLYPQTEKPVASDAKITTEDVPKHGQEEVQRPYREHEWRIRSHKYKTPEELKQIYEASLRPKTDEEIAKIKEQRAIRKNERAERKAQKLKRKQEIAAFSEQRVNQEAAGSTKKRLGANILGDLNGKPLSLKPPEPPVFPGARRIVLQPQPDVSALSEEPQEPSGLISDTRWRADKVGAQNLSVLRPSLFSGDHKNIQ